MVKRIGLIDRWVRLDVQQFNQKIAEDRLVCKGGSSRIAQNERSRLGIAGLDESQFEFHPSSPNTLRINRAPAVGNFFKTQLYRIVFFPHRQVALVEGKWGIQFKKQVGVFVLAGYGDQEPRS